MVQITGKHFIAGLWVEGPDQFYSENPATGQKNDFAIFNATKEFVDQAATSAKSAFDAFSKTSLKDRANFLCIIADEIEKRGPQLTEVAQQETALPAARLEMERGRTVNQLRFFANWIEEGSWLNARIDRADASRTPLPKPDIRSVNKAIGPVAVFGASNFPLAFSTAGGDTASALAAGCPVVVKAHPAHPGTCEIVAQAFEAAIQKCEMPDGVFSQLQGGGFEVGQSLVAHPDIKAVGFTGSLAGGRALYDIAVNRAEPIPFFGELGSNNPVFLLPSALEEKAAQIGEGWAQSLTMGVGQFCTNPGVVVTLRGTNTELFKDKAVSALQNIEAQAMLTAGIAKNYKAGLEEINKSPSVTNLFVPAQDGGSCHALPAIFQVSASDWLMQSGLQEEIFGPGAIIVECSDEDEYVQIAQNLQGQLTATLQMTQDDQNIATELVAILSEKAGRVLVNGFPTGVEVCHSMTHGGPYPASTDSHSTSVGSRAIERFVRPVSYQDLPDQLLPKSLQNKNPLSVTRLVDGVYTDQGI